MGTWCFFSKIVLVDNLFTACALTENIFPAIQRLEYIFFFQIFCLFLTTMLNKLLKKGPGVIPQKVFYRYTETLLYSSIESCSYIYAFTLL